MPAVLFGSISTVADTSELQRDAFNRAFEAHGLAWRWDLADYRHMLVGSGGADRVSEYARSRGETVDAAAVHATKSELFQQSLAGAGLQARPGVAETIKAARARDWKVALVTTTSPANVAALLDALAPEVGVADFDLVLDADQVPRPKPAPDAYTAAVTALAETPAQCLAIEDNLGGVRSAVAAGVPCVAFPNENTAGHDFDGARVVAHLDLDDLIAQETRS